MDVVKGNQAVRLAVLPFLLLFLWYAHQALRAWPYHWGADDTYYYAYLSSAVIDGDLELENQYRLSGLEEHAGESVLETHTQEGYTLNIFPIGPAVLWMPFFLVGHAIAWILNALGGHVLMNGYSRPYVVSVILGNQFYLFAGLYLTFVFLSRLFPARIALISTLGFWICSWMLHYSRPFLNSEAPGMFSVAVVLWLLSIRVLPLRTEGSASAAPPTRILFLFGLACGIAGIIRYQTVALAGVAAAFALFSLPRRSLLRTGAAMAAGFAAGFLPQLMVWKIMYGTLLPNLAGEFLPWWRSPFLLHTLVSARNGLLTIHPITLLGMAGLFVLLRTNLRWGAMLLLALALQLYLNSSMSDWWGAAAFGARRFANCLPVLAAGYAALWAPLKRYAATAALVPVLLLTPLNLHLEWLYHESLFEHEHAVPFPQILASSPWNLYGPVVSGLQLPLRMSYGFRYGTRLAPQDESCFVGEDILFFQKARGNLLTGADNPFFGGGWSPQTSTWRKMDVRWMTSSEAVLRWPMFFQRKKNLHVRMTLLPDPQVPKLFVDFVAEDGRLIATRKINDISGEIRFRLIRRDYDRGLWLMHVRVRREGTDEPRPRIALTSLSVAEE